MESLIWAGVEPHDSSLQAVRGRRVPPSLRGTGTIGALRQYERSSNARGAVQLLTTLGCFAALWIAALACLNVSYCFSLLLAIPAGGFLVRLFVLQHDCGHHTLFRSRAINTAVGRGLSLLTFIPYDQWRRSHAVHHATCGNLDRRGVGEVTTLTVDEYLHLSPNRRLAYRLYRNPVMMFMLGGAYLILLKQRVPFGPRGHSRWWWASSQATNLGIASLATLMGSLVGLKAFFAVHMPIFFVYTVVGIWLFYIEHQFEGTYWRPTTEWSFLRAGIEGSSYLKLPRLLNWLTANIGIHHIHHLDCRIPNYRLSECLDQRPDLATTNLISLRQGLHATRLALWNPQASRLVSFREAQRLRAQTATCGSR